MKISAVSTYNYGYNKQQNQMPTKVMTQTTFKGSSLGAVAKAVVDVAAVTTVSVGKIISMVLPGAGILCALGIQAERDNYKNMSESQRDDYDTYLCMRDAING